MQAVKIESIEYEGKKRLALSFEYNSKLIALIKTIEGYKYSSSKKLWHYPNNEETLSAIKQTLQGVANITEENLALPPALNDEAKQKVKQYMQWLKSKRYSDSTIDTYTNALQAFLKFYNTKPVAEITNEDVIIFNNEFVLKYKLSASYQNQVINAIKLFFRTIQNRSIDVEQIHRPKKPFRLPSVLSLEEVELMLNSLANIKHKTMLALIYSVGLRRSELLNMEIKDVDSKRMLLTIKNGKGNKDRVVPLSETALDLLRNYYKIYKPKHYLFEGQKDLEDKIIRTVGNAEERFSEDALRMLRAVRFATTLNFKIEEKTKEAIKKNSIWLDAISKERIRDEFVKIIMSENPAQGIELLRPLKSSAPLEAVHKAIRKVVPPIEQDRIFHHDILAINDLLSKGAILAAAESVIGPLQ